MLEDQKGNLWFSSLSHAGVSRYDGAAFTHFTHELSDDFVRVVFEDKKGNIWIGTHGNHAGGLDRFDGTHFTAFHKTNDGMSNNNVRWIYEDASGRLWLGSGITALSLFDGQHFSVFEAPDGRQFDRILFVLEDAEGDIWFGGLEGLWRFDGAEVWDMVW
ncbi:MAG: hypothetical protein KDC44_03820, partial [Phaeodactylibacter sp.]|nr:hypothetical protein [Phaeodactylibacter sp.]